MRVTEERIIAFVRGQVSLTDLNDLGLKISIDDGIATTDNPFSISVTASIKDVAKGFLHHHENREDLRAWSRAILGASSFLDLSKEFEETPEGDALLGALWDCMAGEEPTPETLHLIRSILDSPDPSQTS